MALVLLINYAFPSSLFWKHARWEQLLFGFFLSLKEARFLWVYSPQLHLGEIWTTILWRISDPTGWVTEPQVTGKEAALDGQFQVCQALHHVLMGGWSQQGSSICVCHCFSSFSSRRPEALLWSWAPGPLAGHCEAAFVRSGTAAGFGGCGWVPWSCCQGHHRPRSLLCMLTTIEAKVTWSCHKSCES